MLCSYFDDSLANSLVIIQPKRSLRVLKTIYLYPMYPDACFHKMFQSSQGGPHCRRLSKLPALPYHRREIYLTGT
jgi:hypothetical protein